MKRPRVLVGAVIQESNTFSPAKSGMDDFRRHRLLFGDELLTSTTRNELSGFVRVASAAGVELAPTLSANAISSGVFAREAFAELKALLRSRLELAVGSSGPGCDAAYFALHGAMVAEGCDDVEGELIELIRGVIGDVPFVVSLDLHANVTARMAAGVDALVGFRTYPHVDFEETGERSAELLLRMLRSGRRTKTRLRKLPMIVPAENSQSDSGPFFDLWEEARSGEALGESLITSLFPVQPWLDIAEMGCAVVTVGEDEARAEREADRLAELFWRKRHEFQAELHPIDKMVTSALATTGGGGPIVVSDSADSPGAGSTGDSNVVLRELLRQGAQERLTCLLTIVDAPAVAKAIAAGVGSRLELDVGYSMCKEDGEPLRIVGTVRSIGNGDFRLLGGYAKGTIARMGRCVVFDIGRISLLITERATFSGDPSMYRSVGLEPASADLVLVKSANQFRADYTSIAKSIYILDTPGRSPANLHRLSFRKLTRPCFPFDDDFDWRNPG
ncbi:M81 family metallopeptidase [Paenibacillus antri]|uniref:M81 family metallopeptidase n=1 Tax=Paenibacillus antri TaxID=2582848 RepID=UPI0013052DC6|nr:M81 family metallopeptidase [Paenibacillus antri]